MAYAVIIHRELPISIDALVSGVDIAIRLELAGSIHNTHF
jgi:hypothetical protein